MRISIIKVFENVDMSLHMKSLTKHEEADDPPESVRDKLMNVDAIRRKNLAKKAKYRKTKTSPEEININPNFIRVCVRN